VHCQIRLVVAQLAVPTSCDQFMPTPRDPDLNPLDYGMHMAVDGGLELLAKAGTVKWS